MTSRKAQIKALLKSIETGDPDAISVVDESRYIQHNPQTHEGSEGLAALFKRLSQTNPRVNIVRIFEDGDYVFAHTEYDFSRRNVGFELFRFDGDKAVEHWDNIQKRQGPNTSGHSMVDGPVAVEDPHLTEENRSLVRAFVEQILIPGKAPELDQFIDTDTFVEHSPHGSDDPEELKKLLSRKTTDVGLFDYQHLHRILAEGNFVMSVCEGHLDGVHSSFYDLFRVSGGRIVEHWGTIEKIAPKSEWKNDNGKF